jgi:Sphingosine kinase and enzymes related to eukaryotic diacylglycerol kinase
MEPAGIQVSQTKVGAIINTSSGGCDSESEIEMLDILKGAGATNCKTWCGESGQIERAFAEVATHKPEVLVVLGGDGTIRTAAEACTGTDTYLLPLPGGTLNVLPRALYGDSSWQEALKETLANPLTKELSGGRVGDKLFFCLQPLSVRLGCGWKPAKPYVKATFLMLSGKLALRSKRCSTRQYNILFHQK